MSGRYCRPTLLQQLEVVSHTDVELEHRRIVVLEGVSIAGEFPAVLDVAAAGVDNRTLREVVVVTDANHPARKIDSTELEELILVATQDVAIGIGIKVANHAVELAAESGNVSTESDGIAVKVHEGHGISNVNRTLDSVAMDFNVAVVNVAERGDVAILEVSGRQVGLHKAEVIRTADDDADRVLDVSVIKSFVFTVNLKFGIALLVDAIHNRSKAQAAVVVGGADAVVAVRVGLVFVAGAVAEGVLGIDLEAGHFRRGKGQHVGPAAAVASAPEEVLVADVAPARAERRKAAADTVGARIKSEDADAAETDFAPDSYSSGPYRYGRKA